MTNAIPRLTRRGTSLTEVLVALVVLTIGLTSVIALFPVGVNRVRNATLDTRTTLMGMSAADLFQLKRMGNDSNIINWAAYDINIAGTTGYRLPLDDRAAIFDDYVHNKYAFIAPAMIPSVNLNVFGVLEPYYNPAAPPYPRLTKPNATDRADYSFYISGDPDAVPRPPDGSVFSLSVRNASPGYDLSYPLLLDPFLYDQMAINFRLQDRTGGVIGFPRGVPRIGVATSVQSADGTISPALTGIYPASNLPFDQIPYCDIPVVTPAEIGKVAWVDPPPGPGEPYPVERDMIKHRWFASTADVQYTPDIPGFVRNPSARDYQSSTSLGGALTVRDYYWPRGVDGNRPRQGNPIRPTATRIYDYTWAAMMQRQLQGEKATSAVDPAVARPNPNEREFHGKLAILCFYRRNLNQPYSVIEGCFYSGSRKVTLSWPTAGVTAPTINVGTWLCEASISRSTYQETVPNPPQGTFNFSCNRHSGFYPELDGTTLDRKRHYRRAMSFHRVVEVGDQRVVGNRVYLEVLVERPAQGFPLRWVDPSTGANDAQDQRPIDTYAVPRWPIFDRDGTGVVPEAPLFDDETNRSQLNSSAYGAVAQPVQYYPVIIFDGLREVFERTL